MPDTTRIYYIDTWVLSQNLPYYQPETLTSFTTHTHQPPVKNGETLPSPNESLTLETNANRRPAGKTLVTSLLHTHAEDVTIISKSQSLTSVSTKDCTLRVLNKTTTLFLLRVIIKAIFIHMNESCCPYQGGMCAYKCIWCACTLVKSHQEEEVIFLRVLYLETTPKSIPLWNWWGGVRLIKLLSQILHVATRYNTL